MIRHANTLQRVANELYTLLNGATLIDTFSPEKYVVAFIFATPSGNEVNVYASVHPQSGRLSVRRSIGKPRTNILVPFSRLCGQTCHAVAKHPSDRIVSLWFSSHVIHILMFGGGTGNIVVTSDGVVVEALKSHNDLVGQPLHLQPAGAARAGLYEDFASTFPHRAAEIETSTTYFVLDIKGTPTFSAVCPPDTLVLAETNNIFEAIERTVSMRAGLLAFEQRRRTVLADLQRQRAKAEKALAALQSLSAQSSKAPIVRHEADLLMSVADLHRTGLDVLAVADVDGSTRHLTLDPRQSIVENATARYRKAKDADRAYGERLARLPHVEHDVHTIRDRLAAAERAQTIDDLNAAVGAKAAPQKTRTNDDRPVFREFALAAGWTLYVGRNAANNDQLTLRFAKPQDWWLHARGVQGSHAVLRSTRSGERPPGDIIEAAAAVAAWYSAARNRAWVPVIVTQKKWVRKPRKAPVGAVTIDREEVVLVQPSLPTASE